MASIDRTDPALAAMESIFGTTARPESPGPSEPPDPENLDGFARMGPGPFASLRIQWAARAVGDGRYVVDETIGENSAPITSDPMTAEAARQFIEARQRDATERYEQLRREMAAPRPPPLPRPVKDD